MSLLKTLFSIFFLVPLIKGTPLLKEDSEIFDESYLYRAATNKSYRLPDSAVPVSYTIKLSPSIKENDFSFDGESTISINVLKTNDTLYLHAKELTVDETSVTLKSGAKSLKLKKLSLDPATDFLSIQFNELIAVGSWVLSLKYRGSLNDQLRGFYRSSYMNDGVKEWMASTHFEPVGARLAFPCWDEPALKANFKISIKHDARYTALSNMEYTSIETVQGTKEKWTHFPETPKMSTYLVAFVVAKFDYVTNEKDPWFRIWARKSLYKHGKYAAQVGYDELKALETYTWIAHEANGFQKMDSVALPQLSAGAMENWGIITYRESGLLVEENVTSTPSIEGVAKVMSHELAHQWFGNLVSPKWWKYVWLNEGFATYFQYFITDQVLNQKWQLMNRFVVEVLQGSAFVADALISSHPMDVDVESPEEIGNIFDTITYRKAGSVIRMFSNILGAEKFQTALKKYLSEKKFGVSTSDDLIKVLATTNGIPDKTLTEAFTSWVTTPGYPVLTVTKNYTTGKITVKQSRFLYDQNITTTTKYWIPVDYVTSDNLNFNRTTFVWVKPTDPDTTEVTGIKNDTWFIFNKQQFGYYRVNYDNQNWALISNQLVANYSKIHVLNRAQLIDDALNLARVGQMAYNISLPLLKYLKQETDYIPWSSAWNSLSYLYKMLVNTNEIENFKNYVLRLTENLVLSVKLDESPDDDHLTKLQRITLIEKTCLLGSALCRNNTSLKLNKWLKDSKANPLSPDLKSIVLCGGVRSADKTTWNKLLQKFKDEQDDDLIVALGCTSNTGILKNYLLMAFDGTLKSVNRDQVFKAVYSGSDEGVNAALDFIATNSKLITAGTNNNAIKKYVTELGERITNDDQLKKINDLPKAIGVPEDIVAEGKLNAMKNVEWLKLRMGEIKKYFEVERNEPDSASIFTLSTMVLSISLVFAILH